MYNTMKRTFRPPLTLSHSLHDLVHWLQCLHDENQVVRGHRGQRPPSLKKGSRTEARREPPRRFWHLARQRLGPDTSRGRQGARHPPLRGDSATPGRLPAGLRRRLDHDTQARCSRPARAFCPGLLPSRSLPARLQRLAPAARQKKKSGSTPWVVGACGTRAQPPAEASCGRLVRREASACAWLVVRLTCRARGASEAAPRTLGPCVMVGGAGGPPAEVRPWWWPERVSRVGARLRMPLEDSLASGRLSKPRRWLKLGGRADRGWGAEAEFRDRV